MPDITTLFEGSDGATRENFNEKLTDINAHGNDGSAHISTALHTRTGTTNNLDIPDGAKNLTFLATADISDGDSWTINGQPVTAVLQNGEPVPGELFKAGCWVTGVRLSDDGTQLFFKSAGGDIKYNVFCQPTEPTTKTGIWLKTDALIKPKKIVFDDNIWTAGSWANPSGWPNWYSLGEYTVYSYLHMGILYLTTSTTMGRLRVSDKAILSNITLPKTASNKPMFMSKGNLLYIACVSIGENYTWTYEFNPATETFTGKRAFSYGGGSADGAGYNGELYRFGGSTSGGSTDKCEKYTPQTNTVTVLANLLYGNYGAGVDVIGDAFYLVGGVNITIRNRIIKYYPLTNTHSLAATIPSNISGSPCSHVENELFIFGSYNNSYKSYIYNTSNDVFSEIVPPRAHDANYFGASYVGNEILLTGGQAKDSQGNTLNSVVIDSFKLTPKQYPENPSFLVSTPIKDTTYKASVVASKLIDALPTYFKDAMLFKDGDITFPALYIGDGTQWTLARAAQ